MNDDRKKFMELLKNGLKDGEITASERMNAIQDYSEAQERKDLEKYKSFLNTSANDSIEEVQVSSYLGDEEI